MKLLPDTLAAPRPEVMIDGAPRRQVVRQQVPGATAADGVTNPIYNLAAGMFGRAATGLGGVGPDRSHAMLTTPVVPPIDTNQTKQ